MGRSGCGKSSILRTIAGLWPLKEGNICRPMSTGRGGTSFLSQRPYIVVGNLKEQICYPDTDVILEENDIANLLSQVGLPDLLDKFANSTENWEDVLSVGEQQRLVFARILFHKPSLAILDECTSALDVNMQKKLYTTLIESGVTVVSVGHRPELKSFHDSLLVVGEGEGGKGWTKKKIE